MDPESTIRRMTSALSHRGPDDGGYFHEAGTGLWLGHRRLSVIDLSDEGHQPMTSHSGRYVIVFNGEAYNYRRLRHELEGRGVCFRSRSDTEVVVAAIDQWGLRPALERFIGMFAFALWDRCEQKLWLVRDRLGIKPLYYGWTAAGFVLASELKAIQAIPGFANSVSRESLAMLLRHSCIPAPYSIYEGIRKLPPGTMLELDVDAAIGPTATEPEPVPFWSARSVAAEGLARPYAAGADAAVLELEELLRDAIALRMEADVPLGAFLSGGVDSSTVVALMQEQSSKPVRTFSIGFHESEFDEARHARAVAQHLQTDHTEAHLTPREALATIPDLAECYDEPYSDSSQIPTLMVARLARESVTVTLSGDGGDELFGGYNRYAWGRRIWRGMRALPEPLRLRLAASLRSSPDVWVAAVRGTMPLMPRSLRVSNPSEKVARLARVLQSGTQASLYHSLVSHWSDPSEIVIDGREPQRDNRAQIPGFSYTEQMMFADLVGYLPDDILVKVDRASMAVSLEARVPLLDHRLVQFAWRLPLDFKIRRGQSKWILRQVLYRHVPRRLMDRPKQGFGVPLGEWLRGPLRDWAEALLDPKRLREEGFFAPDPIRSLWSDHLAGRVNEHYRLWDVLMFQAWLDARRVDPAPQEARSGT